MKVKRKSGKLLQWNTDMEAKLLEARVARSTISSQLEAAERQMIALNGELADAKLALEK